MAMIAHLVEFCSKGHICPNVIFIPIKCESIMQHVLRQFPKADISLNTRRKKEPKRFDIPLVCMCNLREFCLFVFVALHPKSTAMVIAGRSVHLTTLFPGPA